MKDIKIWQLWFAGTITIALLLTAIWVFTQSDFAQGLMWIAWGAAAAIIIRFN